MEDDNQLVPQLVGKTWMWLPAEPRTPSTRTPSTTGSSTPKGEPPRKILIVGAGIAGIASALSISQELGPYVPDLQITVYERNDVLSTSGGAINLTPVAQRHLDRLGVLDELNRHGSAGGADVDCIELFSSRSGRSLGSIDFTDRCGNGVGGYKGRRVMRIVLSLAMLSVAERTKNISIEFGKKLVRGEDLEDGGKLHFEDGTTAQGDLVLGCDGVHSATRTRWVAPECHSQYTGISFLQSIVDTDALQSKVHFNASAMNISRHGSLLTSYCDRDREQIFLAAIVQFDEQLLSDYRLDNGQDWRTRSSIKRALAEEMRIRFGKSALPCIRELACTHADWILYPVYQVPPNGKWHTDRALLLGDAAHAMPPRDESAAYALDDAILFSRTLARHRYEHPRAAFRAYESLRRDTVQSAFKASRRMWDKNRDMSMLEGRLKEWTLPFHLRHSRDERQAAWEYDASAIKIPDGEGTSAFSSGDEVYSPSGERLYTVEKELKRLGI